MLRLALMSENEDLNAEGGGEEGVEEVEAGDEVGLPAHCANVLDCVWSEQHTVGRSARAVASRMARVFCLLAPSRVALARCEL